MLNTRHRISEPITSRTTEAELVSRAAQGDEAAFEAIMRRHNRLLFRTARSILKNDLEAAPWRIFAPTPGSRPGWCASSPTRRSAACGERTRESFHWMPP
jgi:hypothetical protein